MTDKTVTPPVPGSDEYNTAMIAKANGVTILGADGAPVPASTQKPVDDPSNTQKLEGAAPKADDKQTPSGAPAVKPEGVPDKFWDATKGVVNYSAWAKSTNEAETKITQLAQGSSLKEAVTAAQAELAAATDDAAKAIAQTKLDAATKAAGDHATELQKPAAPDTDAAIAAATAELTQNGKLSDATYGALEKSGYSRETVDAFIEGQSAKAELYTTKVHNEVGGKDEYAKLVKWAESGYTAEQIAAFDADVTSGDLKKATAAVQTLKGLFVAANGQAPAKRIEGDAAPGGAPSVYFKSQHEVTTAMSDPRYRVDEAFRAEVAQKLSGSIKLGVNLGIYG